MSNLQQNILTCIENKRETYTSISRGIWLHPETSNHEVFACDALSQQLQSEGFTVRVGVAGHPTGFTAVKKSTKKGPVIVFLAEYDALTGLGHACGHNLIGVTSALAAVALSAHLDVLGGEIRVYGTPGEEGGENGSAKESFVREGFFQDVDAAMMCHPATSHARTHTYLANDPVDIEFWGKPAHAASIPEKGINALDALIQVYNSINALREHLSDDVRIHGIITNGGSAPNIVPDYASARFYLRAAKRSTLDDVYAKVERIVEGAGLCTGARGSMTRFQNKVDNMIVTPTFDDVYEKHLHAFGCTVQEQSGKGSTDAGNVSQVVPTIHPSLQITKTQAGGHTVEFCQASNTEEAYEAMLLGAKLLAFTAAELMLDKELLQTIQAQHAQNCQKEA